MVSHPRIRQSSWFFIILHIDSCTIKQRLRPAPKSLGHKFRSQTSEQWRLRAYLQKASRFKRRGMEVLPPVMYIPHKLPTCSLLEGILLHVGEDITGVFHSLLPHSWRQTRPVYRHYYKMQRRMCDVIQPFVRRLSAEPGCGRLPVSERKNCFLPVKSDDSWYWT
jgi:hypothetical protein